LFFLLTDFPSSFAEFALPMLPNSGTRRANDMGRPFLVTFLGCSKKVTRQWGETHNAKIKEEVNITKKREI